MKKKLQLICFLTAAFFNFGFGQNLADYTFSNFTSITAGTLKSQNITMAVTAGTFEQNVIVTWTSAGILPTGFSNLPNRSANAIKETSGTYSKKTVTFDSDIPAGSFVFIEDMDQNEDVRITFKNSSGTVIDPSSDITIHLPASAAPTVTVTSTDITLVGFGSNASDPITILELDVGTVREMDIEGRSSGPSNQGFYFATQTILPIELINFQVLQTDRNMVELNWQTASETNNKGFEIEWSVNNRDWENIGFVKGAGHSYELNAYNFIHKQAKTGINYYRLKQLDFDNVFEYSDIVNVDFISNQKRFELYPNPTYNHSFTLYFPDLSVFDEVEIIEMTLYDLTGRAVFKNNLTNPHNKLNVSNLEKGIYLVNVKMNGISTWEKIMIQ